MRKNNGITLIALIITVIILMVLAGVSVAYVAGDNGIVANAMKMEVETAKGEVRDHILLLLNTELVCASADIAGTTIDIRTRYNEPNLINFLKGNQNFAGTDHAEEGAIACIEDFEGDSDGVVELVPNSGEGTVLSKYRIISTALTPEGDKYGVGKHIADGNIFTLEAIITKDAENNDVFEGKYELKYYNTDKAATTLDTVALYLTNQS